jgi:hypothetical protein
LVVGGVAAGFLAVAPSALAAGPNGGECGGAYSPAGQTGTNPATGGAYYVNPPTGGTSGSAGAGTSGGPGFIEANAAGSAGPPPSGGIQVEGRQTQSGVNGNVVVSTSPSACVGSTVAGVGVQVP